jgi:hypothetical protein
MAQGIHSARKFSDHREGHQQAQCATIRAAAAGQDVASRKVIMRPFASDAVFKFAGAVRRLPFSFQRRVTSRQKPNRFAESGYERGYVFDVDFNFANNPRILGFFAFQYDS